MGFLSSLVNAVKRGAQAAGPNLAYNAAAVIPQVAGSIIQSRAVAKSAAEREKAQREALLADEAARADAQARIDETRRAQLEGQAPYAAAGRTGIDAMAQLFAPGGEYSRGFEREFRAPTAAEVEADPGYEFRRAEGEKALLRNASATGTLGSGATGKALQRYNQGYASNEYQNVFNRLKAEFDAAENTYRNNRAERMSGLTTLAGVGQNAEAARGGANAAAGSAAANLAMGRGDARGTAAANIGNIRAGGTIGQGNVWANVLQNVTRAAMPMNAATQNVYSRAGIPYPGSNRTPSPYTQTAPEGEIPMYPMGDDLNNYFDAMKKQFRDPYAPLDDLNT